MPIRRTITPLYRPLGGRWAADNPWVFLTTPIGKIMRRQTQNGFTLVELVVVIVILGVLAAVALPRFVGLQGDARLAKGQAVVGTVKSASALARAAAMHIR